MSGRFPENEMMKFPARVFFLTGIFLIWITLISLTYVYARSADAGHGGDKTPEVHETEIDDIVPQTRPGKSYLKVLTIDMLVPGGGHFYLGNYYTGAAFAGLKIAGALSLYYFYNDLENKRDEYHSIQRDTAADADNIEGYRREYERAHQHFAFAIIGTAAAYISSLFFNYSDIKDINERAVPTFDLRFSCPRGGGFPGGREIFLAINMRI